MSSKGVIRTTYLTLIPCCPCDQSNFAISPTLQSLQRLTNKWGDNGIGSFEANDESLTTAVPLIPLQSPSFITPMKNGQILHVGCNSIEGSLIDLALRGTWTGGFFPTL